MLFQEEKQGNSRCCGLAEPDSDGEAMVFPVVMYGCESWTVKKAECRRIDAFELWPIPGIL